MKKYIKDMLKSFTCGALIGSVCWCFAINTTAASANGNPKTVTSADGISYTMQNSISTGNNTVSAHTFIAASQVVPAWNIGVKPILYRSSNGAIVSEGDWDYSSVDSSGFYKSESINSNSSEYFYSWGWASYWYGSGYKAYQPEKTPSLRP